MKLREQRGSDSIDLTSGSPCANAMLLCLIGMFLSLSGCSQTTVLLTPGTEPASSASGSANSIAHFSDLEYIPRSYSVLGKLYVRQKKDVNCCSIEKALTALNESASDIGADAIVGAFTSRYLVWLSRVMEYDGDTQWTTGLAVKYEDANSFQGPRREPFIVQVFPPLISSQSLPLTKENAMVRDLVFEATQYQLEKRGYFALFIPEWGSATTDEPFKINFSDSNSLLDISDQAKGGPRSEFALFTDLSDDGQAHLYLFSKTEKRVVWEEEGDFNLSSSKWTEMLRAGLVGFQQQRASERVARVVAGEGLLPYTSLEFVQFQDDHRSPIGASMNRLFTSMKKLEVRKF